MAQRKTASGRRNIGFSVAILLGLAIGFFIKRVHVGLIIGLALGLLASGLMAANRR